MLNSSDVANGLPPALSAIHCPNITKLLSDYLASLGVENNGNVSVSNTVSDSPNPTNSTVAEDDVSQRHAVVYIVVVLFFYSFGIGLMMIKYMRKEAEEQEEFKMYRRYMSDTQERSSTSRARLANRLALNALNMVNAIPQTSQVGSKVTFV